MMVVRIQSSTDIFFLGTCTAQAGYGRAVLQVTPPRPVPAWNPSAAETMAAEAYAVRYFDLCRIIRSEDLHFLRPAIGEMPSPVDPRATVVHIGRARPEELPGWKADPHGGYPLDGWVLA